MEISAKVLREVEFRTALRGYDTDDVDEFLENVAVEVDRLQAELRQALERAERAERALRERPPAEDDESLRRTLVLAQRTADLAIKEAQEEAARIVEGAKGEAGALLEQAREAARRLGAQAQQRLEEQVARLTSQRDALRREAEELAGLLEAERSRLREALSAALRVVEQSLAPSLELEALREERGEAPGAPDDIEEQIAEDAAAAAPAPPEGSGSPGSVEARGEAPGGGGPYGSARSERMSFTGLSAVPRVPPGDPTVETRAWRLDEIGPDWPA